MHCGSAPVLTLTVSPPRRLSSALPISPPVSPSDYSFVVPPESPLATSIASSSDRAATFRVNLPRLNLPSGRLLHTRSAEPSPTKSTFSALNQSLPPPEFVPRLTAEEFSAQKPGHPGCIRTQSDCPSPVDAKGPRSSTVILRAQGQSDSRASRRGATLPSLAQIQARVGKGHRRGASADSLPLPREPTVTADPRRNSDDFAEVLMTPVKKRDPKDILNDILNRRPPTPPSPIKESRLPPFLRQKAANARPLSMPPIRRSEDIMDNEAARAFFAVDKPELMVTPPTAESRPAPQPLSLGAAASYTPPRAGFPWNLRQVPVTSPTEARFNLSVHTPPGRQSPRFSSPNSPTGSIRSSSSYASAPSPTLSVPIITCTPAPQTIVRDGIEQDSDEEGEADVVVFDGEGSDDADEERERVEREKRGKAMRERLRMRGRVRV
jgi:hypothetical protein